LPPEFAPERENDIDKENEYLRLCFFFFFSGNFREDFLDDSEGEGSAGAGDSI